MKVQLDLAELRRLGDRLGAAAVADFDGQVEAAVNATASAAYSASTARMTDRINLSLAYVESRMAVAPARRTGSAITATITARARGTTLFTYGAVQRAKAVTWTNSRIGNRMGKLAPHPTKAGMLLPWTRRTGDPGRGIAVDQKAAGITVEVARGRRKLMPGAFTLKGRSGNNLVAIHQAGRLKVLYGPSVYQLFRTTLDVRFMDEIGNLLERNSTLALRDELEKALK